MSQKSCYSIQLTAIQTKKVDAMHALILKTCHIVFTAQKSKTKKTQSMIEKDPKKNLKSIL